MCSSNAPPKAKRAGPYAHKERARRGPMPSPASLAQYGKLQNRKHQEPKENGGIAQGSVHSPWPRDPVYRVAW